MLITSPLKLGSDTAFAYPGHEEVILQRNQPGASKVAAGVVPLPTHVHPPVRLQPLPGVPRECNAPQHLQRLLQAAWDTQQLQCLGNRRESDCRKEYNHSHKHGALGAITTHHVMAVLSIKWDLTAVSEILKPLFLQRGVLVEQVHMQCLCACISSSGIKARALLLLGQSHAGSLQICMHA